MYFCVKINAKVRFGERKFIYFWENILHRSKKSVCNEKIIKFVLINYPLHIPHTRICIT